MKKLFKAIIILLGLLFLFFIVAYLYYRNHEVSTDSKTTNETASIYETENEFLEYLKYTFDTETYNEILKNNIDTNESSNYNFYVVPGMESTVTTNIKTKSKEICTAMTPQGMAVMEKYIFVSSYCHTHKHNSVIYVIDIKTGKFIKEIILPSASHIGGLAYDEVNKKLWVAEYKNRKAYVASISLEQIENYTIDKEITYNDEIEITDLKKSSFLTYYNSALAIGTFNLFEKDKLNVYKINNGTIDINPIYKKIINNKVQGIALHDDFVVMSTSYSINDSELLLFYDSDLEDDLTIENASEVLKFPEKLEQIYVYDNKIYMLFESAAFNYRFRSDIVIDRIITFNITD